MSSTEHDETRHADTEQDRAIVLDRVQAIRHCDKTVPVTRRSLRRAQRPWWRRLLG